MYQISVHRQNNNFNISQSKVKRDWMDMTDNRHAYNCFPVTLTNTLGWSLSLNKDVSFIWNGVTNTNSENVKILSGHSLLSTGRANATISFNTGLAFYTDENLSMMVMPVPNLFRSEFQIFTTIMSTSFFTGEIPLVARIMEPNKIITIKAGTPIANIIPISLTEIQNSEIKFVDKPKTSPYCNEMTDIIEREKIYKQGKWTNFYKNCIDACGNIIGKHEVRSIKLKVIENNENN